MLILRSEIFISLAKLFKHYLKRNEIKTTFLDLICYSATFTKTLFFSKIYLCKIFHLKFLISNENILAPSSKHLTSIAIVELTNDVQI